MDRLGAMAAYVRVVETGSFSVAARQLQLGQPAVSKAVAQLEHFLGVGLLVRSTRRLSTTPAGQAYYERAKRAIEEADEAVVSARGEAAGFSGRLRIAGAACFARIHIVPKLATFLAEHPHLEIELNLDERVIDLIDEGIDVAIRSGALADSAMKARKIAQARRLVMATPAYWAAHGVPATPGDLAQRPAVIYTRDGGGSAWTFRKDGTALDIVLQGRLRMSASEGVRAAVLAGLGCAVTPEWVFTPEILSGEIQPVMGDWVLPSLDLWAVFPAGRLASGKARAFAGFVEQCLAPLHAATGIHAEAE